MKKIISVFMTLVLFVSLSGCAFLNSKSADSAENAIKFYDKVNESKIILDLVATDVCSAWKDAANDYTLSTKDVNNAIEKAKKTHSSNIEKINELDKEIRDLFDKAKNDIKGFYAGSAIKRVMTAYSEYKDSILNANEALDSRGYLSVSSSKNILDSALQDLFVEL